MAVDTAVPITKFTKIERISTILDIFLRFRIDFDECSLLI